MCGISEDDWPGLFLICSSMVLRVLSRLHYLRSSSSHSSISKSSHTCWSGRGREAVPSLPCMTWSSTQSFFSHLTAKKKKSYAHGWLQAIFGILIFYVALRLYKIQELCGNRTKGKQCWLLNVSLCYLQFLSFLLHVKHKTSWTHFWILRV